MAEIFLTLLAIYLVWHITYAIMDIWDARAHPIKPKREPRIIKSKK